MEASVDGVAQRSALSGFDLVVTDLDVPTAGETDETVRRGRVPHADRRDQREAVAVELGNAHDRLREERV